MSSLGKNATIARTPVSGGGLAREAGGASSSHVPK
jgi:hypothetical protein